MSNDPQQQVLQLFVRHQARIKGFIVALTGDFALAEDVLQETFLVVQQKASAFVLDSNFLAWAFQIARFQVLAAQARRARAVAGFSPETIEALAASAPQENFDEAKLALLPGCLEKLAPQARRIVDLFYQDEHKPGEIARRLNWTPAAVSVALSRARTFLRQCIERQRSGESP